MLKPVLLLFPLFLFVTYPQVAMTSDINNYPVTEELLLKMEKIVKEFDENSLKIAEKFSIAETHDSSIKWHVSYLSNQPKVMAIFKNNNITPKDFVAACKTLEHLLIMLFQASEGSEEDGLLPVKEI